MIAEFPRRALAMAAVAATLAVAACSPRLDWREVRPAGMGVVALFPCKPTVVTRAVALAGETPRMALAACEADGQVYALSHVPLADPAHVVPALQQLRSAAAGNVGGSPVVAGPARIPGMTPQPLAERLAVEGRAKDGRALRLQAVFFARGSAVYQASVVGDRADAEAVDTFLAALKLEG